MMGMTLEGLMVGLAIGVGSVVLAPLFLKYLIESHQLEAFLENYRSRIVNLSPFLLLLIMVPVINVLLRNTYPELFDSNGIPVTYTIYTFEGYLVSFLQSFASHRLTTVMSFVYLFVYVFIIFLTALTYLFDPEELHLKELCVAIAFNYLGGLVSYALFVAYGPRVFIDHAVHGLMYQAYPFVWEFTSMVNTPSNVFPSIHASMSVTIALFSLHTRDKFPLLPYIVAGSAVAVIISTMYLGIHWFIDVAAGILLGALSFYVGRNYREALDFIRDRSTP